MHYEEHILELYVLESAEVADRRSTIKIHIEECLSCRKRVEDISAFYAEVRSELRSAEESHATTTDLPRQVQHGTPSTWFEQFEYLQPVPPRRGISRAWNYARRYPIKTSGLGAALLAASLAIAFWINRQPSVDSNPAYYKVDQKNGSIRLYSKEDKELWSVSVPLGIRDVDLQTTKLGDLDGDGRRELVTTCPAFLGGKSYDRGLKIIDSYGVLRSEVMLKRDTYFRGRDYRGTYLLGGPIEIVPVVGETRSEILCAGTIGRSPTVIARIDASGRVLGEFWHFGNIAGVKTTTLSSGKRVILVGASLDIDEIERQDPLSSAAVIVLDLETLKGRTESSVTRGFGFPTSPAEIAYLKFPPNSLDRALGAKRLAARFSQWQTNTFAVRVAAGIGDSQADYEYLLDDKLRVLEVKIDDGPVQLWRQLQDAGKINHPPPDKKLLETVKRAVRYWTGTKWSEEPVFMKPSPQ